MMTDGSEYGAMVEGYLQGKTEILSTASIPENCLKELKTTTKTSVSICMYSPPQYCWYQAIAAIWGKNIYIRTLQLIPVWYTML
jgi:hypothetical protein